MKSTVFYLTLTDEQAADVNKLGWEKSREGLTYLNAKHKPEGWQAARDLYEMAAVVESADVEQIWTALQNIRGSWASNPPLPLEVHTDRPRSMDVGDLIVLGDGTVHICRAEGFDQVARIAPPAPHLGGCPSPAVWAF